MLHHLPLGLKAVLALVVVALLVPFLLSQAPATAKRYALVVGINEYDHDKLGKLNYAVNDATKLAEVLGKNGYEVVLVTDTSAIKPTRANIEAALAEFLKKFARGDTLLIACAGHGMQFGKDVYYCPRDAKPFEDETATMVSLSKIYEQLDRAYRGNKFVLLDACRDDGNRGRRSFDSKSAPIPPQGIGVLLACSDGEKANEHDDLKHGVFFYHVIEALKGNPAALDGTTGDLTWDSLRTFVKRQVPLKMRELYKGDREQEPNELGNLRGIPILVPRPSISTVVEAKPLKAPFGEKEIIAARTAWAKKLGVPEKKTLDLGSGVTLDLVLIPPGVFQMGSPETEKERDNDETQHEVELTQAFYLAVTETTQAQYRAITGANPSRFTGDTLPVESVSWNDAVAFCEKLSKKVGAKVSLPTEAQWEYACRAGTTTAFHFGDVLNGDKANCDGNYPYGTETKGAYLEKTTPAGDVRYPANGFGLRDMHGNVWEWCLDGYDSKAYGQNKRRDPFVKPNDEKAPRVLRGGSWLSRARSCRAARRHYLDPTSASFDFGFRVALRLD